MGNRRVSSPEFGIRRATLLDLAGVYDVCLRTADDGRDASELYSDPSLPGHVWAGAYLTLQPDLAFVLCDGDGVAGYVLGALDTPWFEGQCEIEWWPPLRTRYADPVDVPRSQRTADQRAQQLIHHPIETPASITARYPSHLHIDLVARGQGDGRGRRMLHTLHDALQKAGSPAVHLGVSATNTNAVGFYRHLGYEVVEDFGRHGLVLGRDLR